MSIYIDDSMVDCRNYISNQNIIKKNYNQVIGIHFISSIQKL